MNDVVNFKQACGHGVMDHSLQSFMSVGYVFFLTEIGLSKTTRFSVRHSSALDVSHQLLQLGVRVLIA